MEKEPENIVDFSAYKRKREETQPNPSTAELTQKSADQLADFERMIANNPTLHNPFFIIKFRETPTFKEIEEASKSINTNSESFKDRLNYLRGRDNDASTLRELLEQATPSEVRSNPSHYVAVYNLFIELMKKEFKK